MPSRVSEPSRLSRVNTQLRIAPVMSPATATASENARLASGALGLVTSRLLQPTTDSAATTPANRYHWATFIDIPRATGGAIDTGRKHALASRGRALSTIGERHTLPCGAATCHSDTAH